MLDFNLMAAIKITQLMPAYYLESRVTVNARGH